MKYIYLVLILVATPFPWVYATGPETGVGKTDSYILSHSSCSKTEIAKNKDILKTCSDSWKTWGIDPPPPGNELRDPNKCFNTTLSQDITNFLSGCGDVAFALPSMVAEAALYGFLKLTLPKDKHSRAAIYSGGSEHEITAILQNDFMRSKCNGIGPLDSKNYVAKKCHRPLGQKIDCNPFIEDLKRAQKCWRKQRSSYKKKIPEIQKQVKSIIEDRRQRHDNLRKNREIIKEIKAQCGPIMNPYRKSIYSTLSNPGKYLSIEAKNFVAPSPDAVRKYNDCVKRHEKVTPKIQKELQQHAHNSITQLLSTFDSYQCYNQRTRQRIACEVATLALGGTGLSAFAAKKLGRSIGNKKAIDSASRMAANRSSQGWFKSMGDRFSRIFGSSKKYGDLSDDRLARIYRGIEDKFQSKIVMKKDGSYGTVLPNGTVEFNQSSLLFRKLQAAYHEPIHLKNFKRGNPLSSRFVQLDGGSFNYRHGFSFDEIEAWYKTSRFTQQMIKNKSFANRKVRKKLLDAHKNEVSEIAGFISASKRQVRSLQEVSINKLSIKSKSKLNDDSVYTLANRSFHKGNLKMGKPRIEYRHLTDRHGQPRTMVVIYSRTKKAKGESANRFFIAHLKGKIEKDEIPSAMKRHFQQISSEVDRYEQLVRRDYPNAFFD